jgi:hypothetical protein
VYSLELFARNSSKLIVLTFALLFSSIIYADSFRELVHDESRVILAVENMT